MKIIESPDRSQRTRRKGGRCLPSGDPFDAWLRVLRQTDDGRLGSAANRPGLPGELPHFTMSI